MVHLPHALKGVGEGREGFVQADILTKPNAVRDSTLFRGESLGTQLISNYMQIKGSGYIREVLQPMISKVQNGDLLIEV